MHCLVDFTLTLPGMNCLVYYAVHFLDINCLVDFTLTLHCMHYHVGKVKWSKLMSPKWVHRTFLKSVSMNEQDVRAAHISARHVVVL